MNNGITSTNINVAIRVLNQALAADPEAIKNLVNTRFICNGKFADHPTIQVIPIDSMPDTYQVGFLGILNGILEPMTGKRIAAVIDESLDAKTIAFQVYEPQ